MDRKEQGRRLKAKARLLWTLVTTSAGVADLAEPMKRAEHDFNRLTKSQQLTVAVIASEYSKGCHEIDKGGDNKQVEDKETEIRQTIVRPEEVEIIPPDGDKEE